MKRPKTEHLILLRDISHVQTALAGSTDLHEVLHQIVGVVANHLSADVCSVYLYRPEHGDLLLSATLGLNPDTEGTLTLKLGDGLVGTAMKELRPLCEAHASHNPQYHYFPEAGEEAYDAFLAVPILQGTERVGVLVVQRDAIHPFSDEDVTALEVLTAQLAGVVKNVKALLTIAENQSEERTPSPFSDTGQLLYQGTGASPGTAMGTASVFRQRASLSRAAMEASHTEHNNPVIEEERLKRALAKSASQLLDMQERLAERLPEAAALIVDSHLMMLNDPEFISQMVAGIRGQNWRAETAAAAISRDYMDRFLASRNEYIQEKAQDVEDLALRILACLGKDEDIQDAIHDGRIVIAGKLLPSDLLKLALENVKGMVLVGGGVASHLTIIARSLQLPLVLINEPDLFKIEYGTPLTLDANTGFLYVNPGSEVVTHFTNLETTMSSIKDRKLKDISQTSDGTRIQLMANVNLLSEVEPAANLNADGIGLYRSEFPFLVRACMPSEEEQRQIYDFMMTRMPDKEITVRTLDVGGDKLLSFFNYGNETNPELGLRSTRLVLRHPEILATQVRAILVAASDNDAQIRIMFPMISSIEEFQTAKKIAEETAKELNLPLPPIGMMIEVPSVAELLEEFASLADFFSIGTNDFVQYMLAADRTNQMVDSYYCPHHPAVLRSLERMIKRLVEHGKDVSICGEMAHDPRYIPFFIGVGIRKLSVDPASLVVAQDTIEKLSLDDCKAYADEIKKASTIAEVETCLDRGAKALSPVA
jgi:phosphotransferase system enzyme I (PtsP)